MEDCLTTLRGRIESCCESACSCFRKNQDKPDSSVVIPNLHAESRDPDRPLRPSPFPPVPAKPMGKLFAAQYDYQARTDDDLSFHAGDKLEILKETDSGWWIARALDGASANRSGYIPANYVAPLESLGAQMWYFADTKRVEAEKLLQAKGNQNGSFLIRQCESQPGELSLSVLHDETVKHYKIKQLDGQFYIIRSKGFSSLMDLVQHYSTMDDGLCVRLRKPCRKAIVPQTIGLSYNTADHWEIPRSSVQLLCRLGTGQFGEVYEGMWNNTTAVAVKKPKPGSVNLQNFLQEAQFMKKLHHPKLIQLYAVCTIGEPIYIITELMRNGNLLEYLQRDKGKTVNLSDQVEMAAQVAAGMAYLELQNYIHRDLAARNVLVGENNICKVADFGLARVFKSEGDDDDDEDEDGGVYEMSKGTKLPVKWTAPEGLHENKFSIKSDVWSFGILLYEIITFGTLPYPMFTNLQVVHQLRSGYRMPCPSNCPKRVYEVMRDCWKDSPYDRPTFETLQWTLEEFCDLDVSSYADADRY
ncbi:tyrosine-protein kinase SRK2 [Trichomycterus rosablanca]|uniref:tyrosine-protein kinase SRK2 n=1 Tax=Trichomycterus rosablanca TaxID=2290929 RepID=UPI002F3543C8